MSILVTCRVRVKSLNGIIEYVSPLIKISVSMLNWSSESIAVTRAYVESVVFYTVSPIATPLVIKSPPAFTSLLAVVPSAVPLVRTANV